MKKRLLTLGLVLMGGVLAWAAQLIATPQQLGVFDNVQLIQSAPQKTSSLCRKNNITAQKSSAQLINSSINSQQKLQ